MILVRSVGLWLKPNVFEFPQWRCCRSVVGPARAPGRDFPELVLGLVVVPFGRAISPLLHWILWTVALHAWEQTPTSGCPIEQKQ